MFPLGDYNPTLRLPVVTYGLILVNLAIWLFVQGAGVDEHTLAASICKLGLIPGELTHHVAGGSSVPLGETTSCVVPQRGWTAALTLLTSMFLHGGWLHILGNMWFLRIFGDNVEDSMGRGRYLAFYLLCGLVAAGAQVAVDPRSPVPVIGASGAISGIMGAYLVLFPGARVRTAFVIVIFIRIVAVPAWLYLFYWFGLQLLGAVPQLRGVDSAASSGVAVIAHVAGFLAGALLAKPFSNERLLTAQREAAAGRA
jgi:membrane associated rhomboid family serine protease